MDLREQYRKETGMSAVLENKKEGWEVARLDYAEWLEDHIDPSQQRPTLLIWWTAQEHCIFKPFKCNYTKLPDYVWQEYCNRVGRSGRGRLWVPKGLEVTDLDIEPEAEVWEDHRNLGECAGVVFKEEDVQVVQLCPGHITDLELNLYNRERSKN